MQAAGSLLTGNQPETLPDGTFRGPTASGFAGSGKVKYLGEHWFAAAMGDLLTKKFSVDDLGFMPRANLARLMGYAGWRDPHPGPLWQSAQLIFAAREVRDAPFDLRLDRDGYRGVLLQLQLLLVRGHRHHRAGAVRGRSRARGRHAHRAAVQRRLVRLHLHRSAQAAAVPALLDGVALLAALREAEPARGHARLPAPAPARWQLRSGLQRERRHHPPGPHRHRAGNRDRTRSLACHSRAARLPARAAARAQRERDPARHLRVHALSDLPGLHAALRRRHLLRADPARAGERALPPHRQARRAAPVCAPPSATTTARRRST